MIQPEEMQEAPVVTGRYRYWVTPPEKISVSAALIESAVPAANRLAPFGGERVVQLPAAEVFATNIPRLRLARLAELFPENVKSGEGSVTLPAAGLAASYALVENKEELPPEPVAEVPVVEPAAEVSIPSAVPSTPNLPVAVEPDNSPATPRPVVRTGTPQIRLPERATFARAVPMPTVEPAASPLPVPPPAVASDLPADLPPPPVATGVPIPAEIPIAKPAVRKGPLASLPIFRRKPAAEPAADLPHVAPPPQEPPAAEPALQAPEPAPIEAIPVVLPPRPVPVTRIAPVEPQTEPEPQAGVSAPTPDEPELLVTEAVVEPAASAVEEIENLDGLQALFLTEEHLTVPRVVELCCGLPGINSCVLARGSTIVASHNVPANVDIISLSAHATEMLQAMRASAARMGVGTVPAVTLHAEKGVISFFHSEDLAMLVFHRDRGFVPGVREKMTAALTELAKTRLTLPAGGDSAP